MKVTRITDVTRNISRCYHECPYFTVESGNIMVCEHPDAVADGLIIHHPICDEGFPSECPLMTKEEKMSNGDNNEFLSTPISHFSLHDANIARDKIWNDTGDKLPLSFRGCELAGEAGEACNVIKKLERERLGIRGSRDTVEHLVEELCDVIICAYLIGMDIGVNLDNEVAKKFNETSRKYNLPVYMAETK